MKKLLIILLCFISLETFAYNGNWQEISPLNVPSAGRQILQPSVYKLFSLNIQFHQLLFSLADNPENAQLVELPTPDGSFRTFKIWQTPVMEAALALKYAGIKTFTAVAADNHLVTAKLDFTLKGFHAMIYDGSNTYFIDPYSDQQDGIYTCYYKKNYHRPFNKTMVCAVNEDELSEGTVLLKENGVPDIQYLMNGSKKKTYQLALACTGDYAIAVDGPVPTKPGVLSAMVTSVNRVTGVYERELAVSLVLIANTDTLIFLDPVTDGYSNNNGGNMLGQNQNICDNLVGNANYDIGHVFSTGGGGIASLGCVCDPASKAEGVTGSSNPVGDAFDIDYVAHEMGHQFGGSHTFNSSSGSCGGNLSQNSAYEVGSGNTIMSYAGICGVDDIQQHSDAYFHARSLFQITNYITTNDGATCPDSVLTNNTPPAMPAFTQVLAIPFQTPFELTAPASTDSDHDTLNYCWEQWNRGDYGAAWANVNQFGPIFRSFNPDASRTRVFLGLDSLLADVTDYMGEKLPTVARIMKFKVTVRDILNGIGSYNFPDDTIHLDVTSAAGPFVVTAPALLATWQTGGSETVTWNVAGTDIAPVSCTTVDIWLSTDGGYTYPHLLIAGTPNDGSQVVTIPNVPQTSLARIKVKSVGNVFFNISKGFNLSPTGIKEVSWANTVNVFPVPAKDVLNITSDRALSVTALNAVGQKIWTGKMDRQKTIAINNWARGVYYLQLTDIKNGEKTVKPVVIQ